MDYYSERSLKDCEGVDEKTPKQGLRENSFPFRVEAAALNRSARLRSAEGATPQSTWSPLLCVSHLAYWRCLRWYAPWHWSHPVWLLHWRVRAQFSSTQMSFAATALSTRTSIDDLFVSITLLLFLTDSELRYHGYRFYESHVREQTVDSYRREILLYRRTLACSRTFF